MRTLGYALAAATNMAFAVMCWQLASVILGRGFQRVGWALRFIAVLVVYRGAIFVAQASGAMLFDVAILPVLPLIFGGLAWVLWAGERAMSAAEAGTERAAAEVKAAQRRMASMHRRDEVATDRDVAATERDREATERDRSARARVPA